MGRYSTIIEAIQDILENVTGVQEVFTHEPQQFTKYPSVTVTPLGHHEEYLSLRDTKREYTIVIRVYGQLDNTRVDTQEVIRDLADDIIDELGKQENLKLSGHCDYSELTDCVFKFVQKESSLYLAEITMKTINTYVRV